MLNLTEYKNRLESQLNKITNELNTIGVHNPETDDWVEKVTDTNVTEADLNIEADEAEAWEEKSATLSDLEIEYRDTKRALDKIENNVFGACEICQKSIEENRLDFKPTARTCIEHMNDEGQLSI